MKNPVLLIVPLLLILVGGFLIGRGQCACAHTPCDGDYQPPRCHYVQVVNPISGKLEQQYICE